MNSIWKFGFVIFLVFSCNHVFAQTQVTVSISPQAYFVKKIAGNKVNVNVMVPPGASPATYEPKPKQMVQLSRSKIYFSVGVQFENAWMQKIKSANQKMEIVETQKGIKRMAMKEHHHDSEGYEKDDQAGILDPHIWLSPKRVKVQAANIKTALQKLDKMNHQFYEENYLRFSNELDVLDASIQKKLKQANGNKFMVFHPSWGYFADDYHLRQIAVEVEGKEPGPRELVTLIREVKEEGIRVIFVSPQFSQKAAGLIARSIKGKTLIADPLAENWAENLLKIAEVLRRTM